MKKIIYLVLLLPALGQAADWVVPFGRSLSTPIPVQLINFSTPSGWQEFGGVVTQTGVNDSINVSGPLTVTSSSTFANKVQFDSATVNGLFYTFQSTRGAANEVLTENGAGALRWAPAGDIRAASTQTFTGGNTFNSWVTFASSTTTTGLMGGTTAVFSGVVAIGTTSVQTMGGTAQSPSTMHFANLNVFNNSTATITGIHFGWPAAGYTNGDGFFLGGINSNPLIESNENGGDIQFAMHDAGGGSASAYVSSYGGFWGASVDSTLRALTSFYAPDGRYAQFVDNNAGAPPAGDCDADGERGRRSYDTTNNRYEFCGGASRGWDMIPLSNSTNVYTIPSLQVSGTNATNNYTVLVTTTSDLTSPIAFAVSTTGFAMPNLMAVAISTAIEGGFTLSLTQNIYSTVPIPSGSSYFSGKGMTSPAGTSYIVIPITGYYEIHAQTDFNNSVPGTPKHYELEFAINGTTTAVTEALADHHDMDQNTESMDMDALMLLNAGDTVGMWMRNTTNNDDALIDHAYIHCHWAMWP